MSKRRNRHRPLTRTNRYALSKQAPWFFRLKSRTLRRLTVIASGVGEVAPVDYE